MEQLFLSSHDTADWSDQMAREEALVEPTSSRSWRNIQRAGGDGGVAHIVASELAESLSHSVSNAVTRRSLPLSVDDSGSWLQNQDWSVMYLLFGADVLSLEMMSAMLDVDVTGDAPMKQSVIDRFVERVQVNLAFLKAKSTQPEFFKEYTRTLKKKGSKWASRDLRSLFVDVARIDVSRVEQDLLRRVGMFIMEVAESTQLVRSDRVKRTTHLSLSSTWRQRIASSIEKSALSRPIRRPMVCRPREWNEAGVGGGYLSPWMGYSLVQGDSLVSPLLVKGCNNSQGVAYAINSEAITLIERGIAGYRLSLGDKGYDTKLHKAESDIAEAKSLLGKNFWFCVRLDYRGRVYYLSDVLNPQGWDISKALLMYAEGSPRTAEAERELYIHTANCFGHDKLPIEERYQWVVDNLSNMEANPVGFWKANDPGEKTRYQAWVALCASISKSLLIHINCSSDATNSGLQHGSVQAGCEETARSTNVLPTEVSSLIIRRDAYYDVGEECGLDRNQVKKPVMCIPYGISQDGVADQLIEEGVCSTLVEANAYAALIWSACEARFGRVLRMMSWLKQSGKRLAESGIRPSWTVEATGFRVVMPRAIETHRLTVMNGDGELVKCQFGLETLSGVDVNQIVRGMAPNYIHSYDAALVHLVLSRWTKPIWVVHDCFGTLPHLAAALRALVKQCFIELYDEDAIEHTRRGFMNQGGALVSIPVPPVRTAFDIERVRASHYFVS